MPLTMLAQSSGVIRGRVHEGRRTALDREIVAVVGDAIVKTKYVDMPWCVAGHESLGEATRRAPVDLRTLLRSEQTSSSGCCDPRSSPGGAGEPTNAVPPCLSQCCSLRSTFTPLGYMLTPFRTT